MTRTTFGISDLAASWAGSIKTYADLQEGRKPGSSPLVAASVQVGSCELRSAFLAMVILLSVAAISWAVVFSPLTPITRTETHAQLGAGAGFADKAINRLAPEGWQVSQFIYWKDTDAVTIVFTRQVPWYAPPTPTTTPLPTLTPQPG